MTFWVYLALTVAVILLSFMVEMAGLNYYFEKNGISVEDDGIYVETNGEKEDAIEPSFSYANKTRIIEAFQVGSELLPAWAINNKDLVIVISPESQVILRRKNEDEKIWVPKGDYVLRTDHGYFAVPKAVFENEYQNVEVLE